MDTDAGGGVWVSIFCHSQGENVGGFGGGGDEGRVLVALEYYSGLTGCAPAPPTLPQPTFSLAECVEGDVDSY